MLRRWPLCALTLLLLVAGCAGAKPGKPLNVPATSSSLARPTSSRVMTIVLENDEASEVLGSHSARYITRLARRYGRASQSYGVRHPSLPNYLALTSGSTHGIESDCTSCTVNARNIVDQLEAARISWKAYMEEAPTPCFLGASAGGYAKKHNPFAYYPDITRSPQRCRRLVGFDQLSADLRAGRMPTYSWITPNLCDDGHDCGVAGSDRFLARTVPQLVTQLGPHGFLIITWDEGSSDRGCCSGANGGHILTVVIGPDVRPHSVDASPIDHYGVLASTEEALGLPLLGRGADPRSGRLNPLFLASSRIR